MTLWLVQTLDVALVGGFAGGVLVGVGLLWGTAWIVERTLGCSPGPRRRWLPIVLGFTKLGLIFVALRFLVGTLRFSAPAIASGVTLPLLVIFLKVLGRELGGRPA